MPRDSARNELSLSPGLFEYESNAARRLTAGDDLTVSESSDMTGIPASRRAEAMSAPILLVLTNMPISESDAPAALSRPISARTASI